MNIYFALMCIVSCAERRTSNVLDFARRDIYLNRK